MTPLERLTARSSQAEIAKHKLLLAVTEADKALHAAHSAGSVQLVAQIERGTEMLRRAVPMVDRLRARVDRKATRRAAVVASDVAHQLPTEPRDVVKAIGPNGGW